MNKIRLRIEVFVADSRTRFARVAAVLGVVALLAIPARLTIRAATPAQTEAVKKDEAVDLQNKFERALKEGDKKIVGDLLADNATVAFVWGLASTPLMDFGNTYLTPLYSKSEFLSVFASYQFQSFEDSGRKVFYRDRGFAVSVRGEQQTATGCWCAGICALVWEYGSVYTTTVWTQTADGWRVAFFETGLAGPALAGYYHLVPAGSSPAVSIPNSK
jgi:hypothetical protein